MRQSCAAVRKIFVEVAITKFHYFMAVRLRSGERWPCSRSVAEEVWARESWDHEYARSLFRICRARRSLR